MQIRTELGCCPNCGRDRLNYGAAVTQGHSKTIPVKCDCGFEGEEVFVDGFFVGHVNASGVMCGYAIT